MRTGLTSAMLFGVTLWFASDSSAQTIPELARARPTNPIVRGVLRDIQPVPIEVLAKEAQVILIGRLEISKTYLTPDEENVLTDFRIVPERIISGQVPLTRSKPTAAEPLILTVYGGNITIDGFTVTAVDHNLNLPQSGRQFVLFLDAFGAEKGRYQTHRGGIFEISNGHLGSLMRRPGIYKEVSERGIDELLLDIQKAAAGR